MSTFPLHTRIHDFDVVVDAPEFAPDPKYRKAVVDRLIWAFWQIPAYDFEAMLLVNSPRGQELRTSFPTCVLELA